MPFWEALKNCLHWGYHPVVRGFSLLFHWFFYSETNYFKVLFQCKGWWQYFFGQVIEELFFQVDRIFIQNKNSGWINSLYSVVCINKLPHLYLIVMYLSHFTDYFDRMYFVHAWKVIDKGNMVENSFCRALLIKPAWHCTPMWNAGGDFIS